jgi:pimeloyl-ACP methyl ester carboxylesterase
MRSLIQARVAAGAQSAQLSDGTTAYHVHGERGPWVMLVHGLVTPSYSWEAIADMLAAEGFRVLRYDEFGRGLSDRPAIRYDLDLYVRQLRELTDELGIDTMHLVGWSMGSIIITRFAFEHPTRVESLTLIAPGLFMRQPLPMQVLSRLPGARKLIAWRVGDAIDRLDKAHLSRPDRFPHYRERAREQLEFPGMGESLASTVTHFPWGAGDDLRTVGEHPRPVLVVWGDKDTVTPYANASRVLQLYPRATLLTVEGGRHAPHLDHAELVHPAIVRHLRTAGRHTRS